MNPCVFRTLSWVVFLSGGLAWPGVARGDAIVHLEAAGLPAGPLPAWENRGVLGGRLTNAAPEAPRVAEVAGRRAVVFSGSNWLQSAFPAPAGLAGSNAFTLAVWVYNPDLRSKETVVAWASRPLNCAEFSYGSGRGRSEGAFASYGAGNTGFDGGAPPAGQWHHLAWTYAGGGNGAFRVYVDGRLATERQFSLRTKRGEPLRVGAAWDARAGVPWTPFSGALAEVRIWDRELSEQAVRNAAGWTEAYAGSPANRAEVETLEAGLQWRSGSSNTASFRVYFGTEEAAVAAAGAGSPWLVGEFGPAPAAWPRRALQLGREYFWRVEQRTADGAVAQRGQVWRFRAGTGPAREPRPRDLLGAAALGTRELGWRPGPFATGQTVWFGTNRTDVMEGRGAPLAKLDGVAGRVALGPALEPGRTYYWRVATDNGGQPGDAGPLWQFRAEDIRRSNDVWFFVSSDTHYGLGENAEINRRTIDLMNGTPGLPLPGALGPGWVGTPRGVVLNGDLLDRGFEKDAAGHWSEWVRDYGLNGTDGRLAFPVYEGFGNHDGGPTRSVTRAAIRERNRARVGLTAISANGLHYSWDWDHLHLVQLNLFGGDGPADVQNVSKTEHDPAEALEFLRQDLAARVGASGRPIIVFQHFSWVGGMSDWWTMEAKERFRAVVEPYQVAALINGHSHGASVIDWKGLRTIHNGATARPDSGGGDFLIVHVTPRELRVLQRKPEGWGLQHQAVLRPPAGPGP
ncbi:MAG: hypothetical protein RJA22_2797 [Verrucomicrobiota bacterium]